MAEQVPKVIRHVDLNYDEGKASFEMQAEEVRRVGENLARLDEQLSNARAEVVSASACVCVRIPPR